MLVGWLVSIVLPLLAYRRGLFVRVRACSFEASKQASKCSPCSSVFSFFVWLPSSLFRSFAAHCLQCTRLLATFRHCKPFCEFVVLSPSQRVLCVAYPSFVEPAFLGLSISRLFPMHACMLTHPSPFRVFEDFLQCSSVVPQLSQLWRRKYRFKRSPLLLACACTHPYYLLSRVSVCVQFINQSPLDQSINQSINQTVSNVACYPQTYLAQSPV
jgi:hypothetical protein